MRSCTIFQLTVEDDIASDMHYRYVDWGKNSLAHQLINLSVWTGVSLYDENVVMQTFIETFNRFL